MSERSKDRIWFCLMMPASCINGLLSSFVDPWWLSVSSSVAMTIVVGHVLHWFAHEWLEWMVTQERES